MAAPEVVREDETRFYLRNKNGRVTPVAKSGLSKERRAQYASQLSGPVEEETEEMSQSLLGDPRFDITEKPPQVMFSSELNLAPQQSRVPEPISMTPVPQQGIMGQPVHQQMAPMEQQGLAPATPPASQIPMGSTVTTQTTPGIPMSPEVKEGLTKGYEKQIQAQTETQKALDKYAVENEEYYKDLQARLLKSEARLNDIKERRIAAAKEGRAKVEALQEKYKNAEIDPNRFFGNSTGKRIMAGIAIAFGSFGKAFTGGQTNTALKIINDAIDRDIASQKSEIARLGQATEFQRQMNADVAAAFDDERQAELAKRITMLDAAKLRAESIAKNLKTDRERANAIGFIGKLEAQKADSMAKLEQMSADKVTTSEVQKYVTPESLPSGRQDSKYVESARKLRQEYNNKPTTKKTVQLGEAVDQINEVAGMQTPAADRALIFRFMNVLDPGVAVMEGDVKMIRSASSVPDRVVQAYEMTLGGEVLTEQLREDLKKIANKALEVQQKRQQKVDKFYRGLAERSGIDPIDIMMKVEKSAEEELPENLSATFEPVGRNPAANTAGR